MILKLILTSYFWRRSIYYNSFHKANDAKLIVFTMPVIFTKYIIHKERKKWRRKNTAHLQLSFLKCVCIWNAQTLWIASWPGFDKGFKCHSIWCPKCRPKKVIQKTGISLEAILKKNRRHFSLSNSLSLFFIRKKHASKWMPLWIWQ